MISHNGTKHNYISFLVRLWQEETNPSEWLIQVEQIPSGEKQHLNSLDELFAFIHQLVNDREKKEQDHDNQT